MEVMGNEVVIADQEGVMRVYDLRNFNLLQTMHPPNRFKVVPEDDGVEHRRGLAPIASALCSSQGSLVLAAGPQLWQYAKAGV